MWGPFSCLSSPNIVLTFPVCRAPCGMRPASLNELILPFPLLLGHKCVPWALPIRVSCMWLRSGRGRHEEVGGPRSGWQRRPALVAAASALTHPGQGSSGEPRASWQQQEGCSSPGVWWGDTPGRVCHTYLFGPPGDSGSLQYPLINWFPASTSPDSVVCN